MTDIVTVTLKDNEGNVIDSLPIDKQLDVNKIINQRVKELGTLT